ncbi:hypothetical protein CERSUDRAFT_119747 [Gelatoporia subvermispora B]|uniref:Protein kinase domain-containing protein n=1 Tax=Ceriporiopsis subvermispora (strain B) TaxID=914234 RepID=M2QZW6_CERS8|nr:hypothetical protein CERSUDRAFT_119747 [Gelatoporia subvermispora B]
MIWNLGMADERSDTETFSLFASPPSTSTFATMSRKKEVIRDILGAVSGIISCLKDVSDATSSVPAVGAALAAASHIFKTIDGVQKLDDRYVTLAKKIDSLAECVKIAEGDDPNNVDPVLRKELGKLLDLFKEIEVDIKKESSMNFIVRILCHSSMSGRFDDHTEALEGACQRFYLYTNVRLHVGMNALRRMAEGCIGSPEGPVERGKRKLLLIRDDHIVLESVAEDWYQAGLSSGKTWLGSWNNRAVAVRVLKPKEAHELADPEALVEKMNHVYHPHIAQVLGYSHPSNPNRFYVVETGSKSVFECLKIQDEKERFSTWLRTLVQYEHAVQYASSSGIHITTMTTMMSRPTITQSGRLIVTIDDIRLGGYAGMKHLWQCMSDRILGYDLNRLYSSNFQEQLHVLQDLLDGHYSSWGSVDWDLWGAFGTLSSSSASLGDFGLVRWRRTLEPPAFIKLGNIADIVASDPRYTTSASIYKQNIHPDEITRWPFESGIDNVMHIRVDLKSWCLDVYWDRLGELCKTHGIAIDELVLVNTKQYITSLSLLRGCTSTCYIDAKYNDILDAYTEKSMHSVKCNCPDALPRDGGYHSKGPVDAYFHRLVSDDHLVGPTSHPWGYWSFLSETTPGPWPSMTVRRGPLSSTESYCDFVRLTRFESDFYHYVDLQRRKNNPVVR